MAPRSYSHLAWQSSGSGCPSTPSPLGSDVAPLDVAGGQKAVVGECAISDSAKQWGAPVSPTSTDAGVDDVSSVSSVGHATSGSDGGGDADFFDGYSPTGSASRVTCCDASLSGLLRLQVSIAHALTQIEADTNCAPSPAAVKARRLLQLTCSVVWNYAQVAEQITQWVIPDLQLAVQEGVPDLVVGLLEMVKESVQRAKTDGDHLRCSYADWSHELQASTQQLPRHGGLGDPSRRRCEQPACSSPADDCNLLDALFTVPDGTPFGCDSVFPTSKVERNTPREPLPAPLERTPAIQGMIQKDTSQAILFEVERYLRDVDKVLQCCSDFWKHMEGTIHRLSVMAECKRSLATYAADDAARHERVDSHIRAYRKFWQSVEQLSLQYCRDAEVAGKGVLRK